MNRTLRENNAITITPEMDASLDLANSRAWATWRKTGPDERPRYAVIEFGEDNTVLAMSFHAGFLSAVEDRQRREDRAEIYRFADGTKVA